MSKDSRQTFPTSGVRVISGMQYLVNPETGEQLLTVEGLENARVRHSGIRRWAYIVHEGTHVHWVAATSDPVREKRAGKQIPRRTWARWFGVPEEKIWRVLGGEDGIAACLEYMLHEGQAGAGKTHYSHDDLVASSGWDWESLLRDYQTHRAVSGSGPGPRRQLSLRGRMLEEGLSYREARAQSTVAEDKLRGYRREYLNSATPPATRANIYIQMADGPERVALARATARMLTGGADAYEPYGWNDYDGEAVILAESSGVEDLRQVFGGLSAHEVDLYHQLRTHEDERRYRNAEYVELRRKHDAASRALFRALSVNGTAPVTVPTDGGSVRLHHRAVVVVGSQPFTDFLADLESLYGVSIADPARRASQTRMSMPVFVPVDAETVGVQLLGTFVEGSPERDQYVEWKTIKNNLGRAVSGLDPAGRREIESRQVEPIIDAHQQAHTWGKRSLDTATRRVVKDMVWDV